MVSPTLNSDIHSQINGLPKEKWVDLEGLIQVTISHFTQPPTDSKDGTAPHPKLDCLSISHLGDGSFHHVYQLVLTDGRKVAASIPKDGEDKKSFDPNSKLSEIATMKFVRESKLYGPDVPVPQIYAWDVTYKNPVKAPYVLMEVVQGVVLEDFDDLAVEKKLAAIDAIANLKAALSRPVPFKHLGSLTVDPEAPGGYSVGPFKTQGAVEGEKLRQPGVHGTIDLTPRLFSELHGLLSQMIPHFDVPKSCSALTLFHPDIAFRNVLFDEESLKQGRPKIAGVIDWAGAQILPLMLTAQYPSDLMSDDKRPFIPVYKQPEELPFTTWSSVPYDWTSLGDPAKYERQGWWGDAGVDYRPEVSAEIEKFYLRTHFSACYASHMQETYRDYDLSHTSVFHDAVYYLKFHECMLMDVRSWYTIENWVRNTYWRLRAAGANAGPRKAGSDAPLVTGPNVFHGMASRPVIDLALMKEERAAWGISRFADAVGAVW